MNTNSIFNQSEQLKKDAPAIHQDASVDFDDTFLSSTSLLNVMDFYAPLSKEWRGVVSIPHSGETIPEEFNPYLCATKKAYNEDIDFKVAELISIDKLRLQGVGVLVARIHRVAIELNRTANESVLYWEENTNGVKMVGKTPEEKKRNAWVHKYYHPYYGLIKYIFNKLALKFPEQRIPFVDLHSMPSKPTSYHLKLNPEQNESRPHFCISDLKGKSCAPEYITWVKDSLSKFNFSPAINNPYFGGNLTKYAARFATNAIQIEINRSLYMNEKNKTLLTDGSVEKLREALDTTLSGLFMTFGLKA